MHAFPSYTLKVHVLTKIKKQVVEEVIISGRTIERRGINTDRAYIKGVFIMWFNNVLLLQLILRYIMQLSTLTAYAYCSTPEWTAS